MSAPPGHNPEVSMLQGGNAAITPMQGGGGPPPGYSGESMLQGGTAAITPLQGGAARPGAEELSHVVQRTPVPGEASIPAPGNIPSFNTAQPFTDTENSAPAPEPAPAPARARSRSREKFRSALLKVPNYARKKASTDANPVQTTKFPYPIEYYSISQRVGYNDAPIYTYLRAKEFFLQTQDAEFKNNLLALMNDYEQRRIKEVWVNKKSRTAATLPTRGSIRGTPQGVLTQFSRAVYTLPEGKDDLNNLIVIPPINGDVKLLVNALADLEKYNIITTENGKINIREDNLLVFMPPYYAEPISGTKDNRGKNIALLSIFLEIEAENNNQIFVLAEHMAKSYKVGEVFHEYRRGSNNPFLNFLEPSYILGKSIILTCASPEEPALPLAADAAWGPFSTQENAPENALVVRTLGEDGEINLDGLRKDTSITGCSQYRGNKTLTSGTLRLTKEKAKGELADEREVSIMLVVHLDGRAGPICQTGHTDEKGDYISPTRFYPSDKLIAKDAATTPIEFVDKDEANKTIYQIRIPRLNNAVFEDWNNGRYTEGETAFLNSLDIYPMMLEEIFRDDRWQTQVAFFLQSISVSNCYNDDRLLLRSECEFNRNFLERIHAFFVEGGLTVDRRKQLRDLEEAAELAEYRRLTKEGAAEDAQNAATLPEKIDGMEKISRFQFHNTKKSFGTLYVYAYGDKMAANFMLINQATGAVSYYRTSVSTKEYEEDSKALEKALNRIREMNSAFFVVY